MENAKYSVALLVRLEVKPGMEGVVRDLLASGPSFVKDEPGTTAWFAVQIGPHTFGIFDVFPDDAARTAHLQGRLAKVLLEKAPEVLTQPPTIEKIDVIATTSV